MSRSTQIANKRPVYRTGMVVSRSTAVPDQLRYLLRRSGTARGGRARAEVVPETRTNGTGTVLT